MGGVWRGARAPATDPPTARVGTTDRATERRPWRMVGLPRGGGAPAPTAACAGAAGVQQRRHTPPRRTAPDTPLAPLGSTTVPHLPAIIAWCVSGSDPRETHRLVPPFPWLRTPATGLARALAWPVCRGPHKPQPFRHLYCRDDLLRKRKRGTHDLKQQLYQIPYRWDSKRGPESDRSGTRPESGHRTPAAAYQPPLGSHWPRDVSGPRGASNENCKYT